MNPFGDHPPIDVLWVLLCTALVFFMQAGFCCLEYGCVRKKNSINVAIKNVVDFLTASMLFWVVGCGLMFGATLHGWLGTSNAFLHDATSPWDYTFFLFQAMFCGTAATIVSGAIAERARFKAYMLVSVAISALIYPVFGHWAWGGLWDKGQSGWLENLGFLDFAGSTVVHSIGAWVALAGVVVLGPRLGRYAPDGTPRTIAGQDIPAAALGTFILWLGWFGFNGGSTLAFDAAVPGILLNTCLAASAGGLSSLTFTWWRTGKPDVIRILNGTLGGLVGITAGCAFVLPASAVVIGGVAGLLVCLAMTTMERRFKLDDPVGAIAVHGAAGAWGTLAVALFALPAHIEGAAGSRMLQLAVQGLGVAVAFLWAGGVGYGVFRVLAATLQIRVSVEDERAGLNASEHGARDPFCEVVTSMQSLAEGADYGQRLDVEENTDAGEAAAAFNRMAANLECVVTQLGLSRDELSQILVALSSFLIAADSMGNILHWNPAAERLFGRTETEVLHTPWTTCGIRWDWADVLRRVGEAAESQSQKLGDVAYRRLNDTHGTLSVAIHRLPGPGGTQGFVLAGEDVSETRSLEMQLVQAQKLEAIGQLAAGIAHEINTPTQYVGDNVRFLQDAFESLRGVLTHHGQLLAAAQEHGIVPALVRATEAAAAEADVAYLLDEIPRAVAQSLEGVTRVAGIVGAMKEFSHPGGGEKQPVDLTRALETTITVARNEWRYVADLVTDFAPGLPRVPCLPGELNQVILNLLVNAAHAIADVVGDGAAGKGTITVRTRHAGSAVEIHITDTGTGIPENIKARVFDPFFTTKEVGKGTGQGLAIARSVVVDKHGGTLTCETAAGAGTTFIIRLPLETPAADAAPAALEATV